VSGLTVTKHSFTATGKYGAEPDSAAYTLTVTAVIKPTLSNVLDDRNKEVPEGTSTFSTSLTLKGTASKDQDVGIYDGSGASAVLKGTATADKATGLWERTITVAVGARRLYAKSLYHSSSVYSNVRHVSVIEDIAPTIDSANGSPSGADILPGGTTRETAVTLSGSAAKGQSVRVFDGETSKGDATADPTTGIWERLVSGLSIAEHNFTAKALYGAGDSSQQYKVNIINYDIEDFEKCASEDVPENANYSTPLITLKWQVTNPQGLLIGKINLAKQLYIFAAQVIPGPQSTTKVHISLSTPCSRLGIEHHLNVSNNPTGRINYYNTADNFLGFKDLALDTYTNTTFSGSNIKRLEIIILGGGNMWFDNIKMEY
jgi:hypothetical protein